jgi:uncharacterized membrane protein
MDSPFRLIVAALLGGLFLLFATLQANAHPKSHSPKPEPAQVEKTTDHKDGDGHEEGAHDDGGHDTSGATANEATGGHHGAADATTRTFSQRLISWLGSFHPAAVHIPIGLLLAALISEGLLITTGQPVYASIVRYCIWVGAIGAFLAAPLGWFNAGFQLTDTEQFVTTHRWVGTAAAAWSVVLLFILGATKDGGSRTMLRLALLIGVGLVAFNGLLGGLMIHGADAHAF